MASQETHFLYFGFGSNMDTNRIKLSNPTAIYIGNGYIDDYELAFYIANGKVGGWGGATATLNEVKGKRTWGTIWKIGMENLASLDKQEGVPYLYIRYKETVTTENGEKVKCVVYRLNEAVKVRDGDKPSKKYIKVMREGAMEHNLPKEYQEYLCNIEDNGYDGKEALKAAQKDREDIGVELYTIQQQLAKQQVSYYLGRNCRNRFYPINCAI